MQQVIQTATQRFKFDKEIHGRIINENWECPFCSTYCPKHIDWLLENGFDIIPEHIVGKCAGFVCGHNEPSVRRVRDEL